MSVTTNSSAADAEQLLTLPKSGRTLAFEHTGPPTSQVVVIFLTGALSVGTAIPRSRFPPAFSSRDVHYLAPTSPGYGRTSPPAQGVSYASTIAEDISALLDHLYPPSSTSELELYIAGGSFGTVAAQMLYGAPPSLFPQGKYIRGMLLLGPFPPLAHCTPRDPTTGFSSTKDMSWHTYLTAGPPTQFLGPTANRLVQRLLVLPVLKRQLSTVDSAVTFLRQFLFDKMDENERNAFALWRQAKGYAEGELEREMAGSCVRSVQFSWEGLLSTPEVLYSEWWDGRKIEEVEEERFLDRGESKIMLVTGDKDDMCPPAWAEYLKGKYRNANLKVVPGGHICAIFSMDEIWEDFLNEP